MKANFPSQAHLEDLYRRFHNEAHLNLDPLGRIPRHLEPRDFELISFIVAGLSYGRVAQIQSSTEKLFSCWAHAGLGAAGEGLADWLISQPSRRQLEKAFSGWRHRMNTSEDLVILHLRLAEILREHGSLCALFQKGAGASPRGQIVSFCSHFQSTAKKDALWRGTGLEWFACSPDKGGTSKRLMMWLRWMIRKDDLDPGIWKQLAVPQFPAPHPRQLFFPLDTHVFQWAFKRGLVSNKTPSWKSVEELTALFRDLDPEDPVKYDFAICHSGMISKISGHTEAVQRS